MINILRLQQTSMHNVATALRAYAMYVTEHSVSNAPLGNENIFRSASFEFNISFNSTKNRFETRFPWEQINLIIPKVFSSREIVFLSESFPNLCYTATCWQPRTKDVVLLLYTKQVLSLSLLLLSVEATKEFLNCHGNWSLKSIVILCYAFQESGSKAISTQHNS